MKERRSAIFGGSGAIYGGVEVRSAPDGAPTVLANHCFE